MRASLPSRSALRQWEQRFGPNMTPMVDIVMVILIFFMAGTALVGPEWVLRAAIPTEGRGGAAADPFELPPARFEVGLSVSGGATVVNGLGLAGAPLDQAEAAIAALGADSAGANLIVTLRPAPDVPYRDVVRLHDACERAGITRVALSPPTPPHPPAP